MTEKYNTTFVACPECGHEQADMGAGVACENCGYGPMPTEPDEAPAGDGE